VTAVAAFAAGRANIRSIALRRLAPIQDRKDLKTRSCSPSTDQGIADDGCEPASVTGRLGPAGVDCQLGAGCDAALPGAPQTKQEHLKEIDGIMGRDEAGYARGAGEGKVLRGHGKYAPNLHTQSYSRASVHVAEKPEQVDALPQGFLCLTTAS